MGTRDGSTQHEEPSGFRAIPPVNAVLRALAPLDIPLQPEIAVAVISASLEESRRRIAAGEQLPRAAVIGAARDAAQKLAWPRLTRVLNGTGIIIHTNLGRAPVSAETATAMAIAAGSTVPLEIDPQTNARGGRMREIADLLRALTGGDAALVVNNNAAAVLLALAALSFGREVIISRGEAVEIGGGFRIPDVMRQSGARLVEVGTTNRTYARDYEQAIGPETAAILKVHPSNFAMSGFVAAPSLDELVAVGDGHRIPVIEDLGSGAMLDTARFGLAHEPTVRESLAAGVSVVMASGDKLLGGPQAGIIAGQGELLSRIASHPLARAVRADKTCLAGIAATLRHYARGDAEDLIPVWRMIRIPVDELNRRARQIVDALAESGAPIAVTATSSSVGGGTLPGQELPSAGLRWSLPGSTSGPDELARTLRTHSPVALFGRIQDGAVIIDLRTILPEEDEALIGILLETNRSGSAPASGRE